MHADEAEEGWVVIVPKASRPTGTFRALQEWEGYVLDVYSDSFVARLVDLTEPGPDEEAEFPIEDVSYEDRDLIEEGAVFYWTIGYYDSPSGQRKKESRLRFRRLPTWKRAEIEAAEREAQELLESLHFE